MESKKMVPTVLQVGEQRRHRCKEQTLGLSWCWGGEGRGAGWEEGRLKPGDDIYKQLSITRENSGPKRK